jgi:TM2 domain-containing membrane protein YozV
VNLSNAQTYYIHNIKDSLIHKNAGDTNSGQKTDSLKKKNEVTEKFKMHKSPWAAVGYSAIFPGLGQFYNESYWKLPIIAFFTGYLGYEIFSNNNKFLDYRDKYANSQTELNPFGDTRLRDYREFYRDQRDQFILYFGLFYLINLADAYVDAQLFDFNVNDKIKLGLFRQNKIANLKITF